MQLPNFMPLIILIVVIVIIWFINKNKEEGKTTNVRSYKKTITVKGHPKKTKSKSKNRRSGKR